MTQNDSFLKLAETRYSVRKFTAEPLKQEELTAILKAGLAAPTARNQQPQRILAITGETARAALQKCTPYHYNAPAALLVCYDKNDCYRRDCDGKTSGDIDASIVATHMMLEAAALGIGSTWVMCFTPDALRTEFHIPENIEPVALLVMGYPAPDAAPAPGHTQTKPLDAVVFYDRF